MGKKLTNDDFIERSKKMGVYDDYIFLDKYINTRTIVRAIHKKCGKEVDILPRDWFRGNNRCKDCTIDEKLRKPKRSKEEVIRLVNDTISSDYKLCSVWYVKGNANKGGAYYVKLFNKITKDYPVARLDHIIGDKRYSDGKAYLKSVGEIRIKGYLDSNHLEYEAPKTFDDLVDKEKLHFDVYVPKYNLLIEYQGEQHYNPYKQISIKPHAYELQVKHDNMKRNYAKDHHFNYLEIPYTIKSYSDIYKTLNKCIASINAKHTNN